MEVKLDRRIPIEVGIEPAWVVLRDLHAVTACMPGAQITARVDDRHFKGSVKSRVGPAVMNFTGDVELLATDAVARVLELHAKGSDRSGSSASMHLRAHLEPGDTPDRSVLVGSATVTVSGKLAQFGSRLLVPVSDAILAQFGDNFRAATAAAAAPIVVTDEPTTVMRMIDRGQQPGAFVGHAAPLQRTAQAQMPAPASAPTSAATPPPAIVTPSAAAPLPASQPPSPPPPASELNLLALAWTLFRNWLARLLGRDR